MLRITYLALAISFFATIGANRVYSINTIDISTGIKASLPATPTYPYGSIDQFWKVKSPNNNSFSQAYIPNVSNGIMTAWITIPGTRYINSNQTRRGNYEYERCFCLENPRNARMFLAVRADNTARVFLNGFSNQVLSISNRYNFRMTPTVKQVMSGFRRGKNCIRIVVNNEGSVTGLDAKIKVSGIGAKQLVKEKCLNCTLVDYKFENGTGGNGNSGKCPKVTYPIRIGTHSSMPVCKARLSRKIKASKCTAEGGQVWGSNCIWNKNSYFKARKLK